MSSFAIRDFAPADAEPVSRLLAPMLLAEELVTPDLLRARSEAMRGRVDCSWLVAEQDTRLVGYGSMEAQIFHGIPELRRVWVGVEPDRHGRGLGSGLYQALVTAARSRGARTFKSWCRADQPDSISFLERQGYRVASVERQWRLRVSSADVAQLSARRRSAADAGVQVVPLAQLRGREQQIYETFMTIDQDSPSEYPAQPVPYELWRAFVLDSPVLDWDLSVAALAGDQVVGLAWVNVDWSRRVGAHEITGTHPAYRRRGLARLLKLEVIARAQRAGIVSLGTANDSTNRDILALNEHLGYTPLADAYTFLLEGDKR